MSEAKDATSEVGAAAPDASPNAGRESIGSYLAAQRRLRGISIEDLSKQTRIPLRSLERLESGLFDADVDGFVRGFVRTVAEALGLDADETLNRTLREPGDVSGRSAAQLSLPRIAATALVLALLAGVGFAVQLIAVSLAEDGGSEGSRSPIVMRRDPVRALAEAQGIGALPSAPAPALASRARNEDAEERSTATGAETAPDSGRNSSPDSGRDSSPTSDAVPGVQQGPPAVAGP